MLRHSAANFELLKKQHGGVSSGFVVWFAGIRISGTFVLLFDFNYLDRLSSGLLLDEMFLGLFFFVLLRPEFGLFIDGQDVFKHTSSLLAYVLESS